VFQVKEEVGLLEEGKSRQGGDAGAGVIEESHTSEIGAPARRSGAPGTKEKRKAPIKLGKT